MGISFFFVGLLGQPQRRHSRLGETWNTRKAWSLSNSAPSIFSGSVEFAFQIYVAAAILCETIKRYIRNLSLIHI